MLNLLQFLDQFRKLTTFNAFSPNWIETCPKLLDRVTFKCMKSMYRPGDIRMYEADVWEKSQAANYFIGSFRRNTLQVYYVICQKYHVISDHIEKPAEKHQNSNEPINFDETLSIHLSSIPNKWSILLASAVRINENKRIRRVYDVMVLLPKFGRNSRDDVCNTI